MRIFAIETVYRSPGSKSPGIDKITLGKENLLNFLKILTQDQLLQYKPSPVRLVRIQKVRSKRSKNNYRELGIPTIGDRIVQTLFVQVIEPIIDPHADKFSFGYRKGRNAHQAIGELTKVLYFKPYNKRINFKMERRRYFIHTKFVIQVYIEGFFDSVNQEFLIKNYPIPVKYINILKG